MGIRKASAKRVADAYMRNMDDYSFIPPFKVNREIKGWLSLGRSTDYIINQLMRSFSVGQGRAKRMLEEYHKLNS